MPDAINPPPPAPTPKAPLDWRYIVAGFTALLVACVTVLVALGKLPASTLTGTILPVVIAVLVPSPAHPQPLIGPDQVAPPTPPVPPAADSAPTKP